MKKEVNYMRPLDAGSGKWIKLNEFKKKVLLT